MARPHTKKEPILQLSGHTKVSDRLNVAEFWLELRDRFVHIRYLAIRDVTGAYRGCLEVSQDVTAIRSLEGE